MVPRSCSCVKGALPFTAVSRLPLVLSTALLDASARRGGGQRGRRGGGEAAAPAAAPAAALATATLKVPAAAPDTTQVPRSVRMVLL